MANQVEPKLSRSLYEKLQKESYVLLATIDHETGGPNVNAISWIYAKSEETICFAIDNRSRVVLNIRSNPKISLTLLANESTYTISGDAFLLEEILAEVPLKLALIEMNIREVRDAMFYGSKITNEPQYNKTYDEKAAARLDRQVMTALKAYK